ncbi:MAG: protecting protein DprA [Frankiales bacterium]|nr:protecting protein DprA [Frankiales bacterium]
MSAEDLLARVGLARVVEPGSRPLWEALQTRSATEVWAAVQAGEPLDGLGQQALDGIVTRVRASDPSRDLDTLVRLDARAVCPGDDEWPEGLDWHPDTITGDIREMAPPLVLFVRGPHDLRAAAASSVAVVGARAATPYGQEVARSLSFDLAETGLAIVSGGAYGIDAAAHRGALLAEGAPTVAVLAGGLDVAYPRGNDRLLEQIGQKGLLVSEHPPGRGVTRLRFLVRNRLVAALTQGAVVVEAAERSGSQSTAGRARDLGRKVMAVPGPVTSVLSRGSHLLIRDGAQLVTRAAEVLEELGAIGEVEAPALRGVVHPRDRLEEQTRRILDALPVRKPVSVAQIAVTAGVSLLMVQVALPELVGAGLVEQRDGGWRLTTLGAT